MTETRTAIAANTPVSLNLNVRGIPRSATLSINELVAELRAEGRTVYNLGLGQSPFPVPDPIVEELRRNAHRKEYLPVTGLPALREGVTEFHRVRDGVDARPENVLVGPGSKELLFLLQLCFYGEILVPTPCWVSYVPQAHILGRTVRLIPTSFERHWHIHADDLAALCHRERDDTRPRLLVLNYPGNPDGETYGPGELEAIAEVARRYGIILLSDEIYGRLRHKGEHVSVGRFYSEGTIISSGISKWCGAGGWRLGTFTFPPDLKWLMEAMASVASETYTSVSAPIQYAAVAAYRDSDAIPSYLFGARRILSGLGTSAYEALTAAGVRLHPPEGAFYLFPDFTPLAGALRDKGVRDSVTLCERLLDDTGVAALPGEAFGRPPEELTCRMAYVDFDGAAAMAKASALPPDEPLPPGFFEECCGAVVEAVRRTAEWVSP